MPSSKGSTGNPSESYLTTTGPLGCAFRIEIYRSPANLVIEEENESEKDLPPETCITISSHEGAFDEISSNLYCFQLHF